MKFIAVCLLALVAFSSLQADDIQKYQCIGNISDPCQQSDDACLAAYQLAKKCVNSDCGSKISNLDDFAKCIKDCKSTNSKAQGWIDENIKCVGSGLLSFFVALIMSLFAIMF